MADWHYEGSTNEMVQGILVDAGAIERTREHIGALQQRNTELVEEGRRKDERIAALAATPAQSLAEHDREVRRKVWRELIQRLRTDGRLGSAPYAALLLEQELELAEKDPA